MVTRKILHFVQGYGNLENGIAMVLMCKTGAVVKANPASAGDVPLLANR